MSEDRYQQRQQRQKEKVDARVAAAQEERGILIVFTGNGKGKTTQHLAPPPAQLGTDKKWALFSLSKVNGRMGSVIYSNLPVSNFR